MISSEKKKNSPQSQSSQAAINVKVQAAIMMLFFSLVWFFLVQKAPIDCSQDQYVSIDYRIELLRCSPIFNFNNYIVTLPFFIIMGLYLIAASGDKIPVMIMVIFAFVFATWGCCGSFFRGYSTLTHIHTIEFDEHIYHMAKYDYSDGDIGYDELIILFECEMDGIVCQGREIAWFLSYTSLRVDAAKNQLQIVAKNEVIFTLDAGQSLYSSAP